MGPLARAHVVTLGKHDLRDTEDVALREIVNFINKLHVDNVWLHIWSRSIYFLLFAISIALLDNVAKFELLKHRTRVQYCILPCHKITLCTLDAMLSWFDVMPWSGIVMRGLVRSSLTFVQWETFHKVWPSFEWCTTNSKVLGSKASLTTVIPHALWCKGCYNNMVLHVNKFRLTCQCKLCILASIFLH